MNLLLSTVFRRALAGLLILVSCPLAAAADGAVPFSQAAYDAVAKDRAVVLVAANWNRRWGCGAYENAQLRGLGFDRAGAQKEDPAKPDLLIEDGWLPARKGFTTFALIVEPGEYLLSSYKVKVAKSVSEVGHVGGDRTTLLADGKSKAGSFSARAGEIVYIGHFSLDCAQVPIPWRYYPEDKAAFSKYLGQVAREYPGLPSEQAKFRLFDTTVMGNPYRLPE